MIALLFRRRCAEVDNEALIFFDLTTTGLRKLANFVSHLRKSKKASHDV
jgi:uncharacterized protein YprB with RNaseH-like and TPR domain